MKATQKLSDVYKESAKAASAYGLAIKHFSDTLLMLFSVECPESVALMTPICELLTRLSASNQEVGDLKRRVSDDLRDINERFTVLARAQAEQRAAVKAARDANAALKKFDDEVLLASNRSDFNKVKADVKRLRLRSKKKELLIRARDRTQALIQGQKRFANFRFRRTREAFIHLGQMITFAGVHEIRIVTRLIEGLQKARSLETLTDTSTETIDVPLPASPNTPKKPEAATQLEGPKEIETAAPPETATIVETPPFVEVLPIVEAPLIAEAPPIAEAKKEGGLHLQWDANPKDEEEEEEEEEKKPLFDEVDGEGLPSPGERAAEAPEPPQDDGVSPLNIA
jgi:hypothetical protein